MSLHKHKRASAIITALTALTVVTGALLLPSPDAMAFCGFYVSDSDQKLFNDATKVVLMREGTRTALSMQNTYQGPPGDFAMVVPVPVILKKENVKTLENQIFADVDAMASPRLVEYWEQDPCYEPLDYMEYETDGMMMEDRSMAAPSEAGGAPMVRIEAQFKVGEYEVVILSADDSTALDTWLRANKYNIPEGAEPAMRPYIEQGMYFFVAKVDIDKVKFKNGRAELSPLRFHYDSESFSLPVRLGLLNAKGHQDLIVHILAQGQRYEMANFKNVTIPTNLGVDDEVRTRFGEFYAALFDKTLARNPGAVVTEYSWDASTCDPCPGPNLGQEHFNALGAEVMPSKNAWGYTLTRLHARYTKDTLGEDMVFQAAPPIAGGREHIVSGDKLEEGAQSAPQNNFQGRYIIRHLWAGAIDCDSPRRGVWGGPPADYAGGGGGVQAAQDTAFAPRGEMELARVLTTPAPEIGIEASALTSVGSVVPKSGPNTIQGPCGTCTTAPATPVSPLGLVLLGGLGLVVALRRRSRANLR